MAVAHYTARPAAREAQYLFLQDAANWLGDQLAEVIIGGVLVVLWLGGALKISDRNQSLGIVWFVCFPATLILMGLFVRT